MPPGRPRTERAKYAFVRLREETHKSWLEVKRSLTVSSDDALACWLLRSVSGALDHPSVQLAEGVGRLQRYRICLFSTYLGDECRLLFIAQMSWHLSDSKADFSRAPHLFQHEMNLGL